MSLNFLQRFAAVALVASFSATAFAISPRLLSDTPRPHAARQSVQKTSDEEATYRGVIVELEDESDLDVLDEMGAITFYHRGNLALCCIPQETATNMLNGSKTKGIKRFEIRMPNAPVMDIARTHFGAERIYTGEGLPSPYTGKGVVVGFCDTGFDASHPTFLTSDRSKSRIAQFIRYDEQHGRRTVTSSPEEYLDSPTDDASEAHATHVAGIMAGAYTGNGYHGMAPDATIVATTSTLSDVGILAGAEDIIAYAKSIGAPAVINMSVGSYTGPHDGSSLFCQYLDMLGKEAIICIASGNEGHHTNTITYTFTEQTPEIAVRFASRQWTQFDMYGMVDCWSNNDSPFKIRLCIYDEMDEKFVEEYPYPDFSTDSYTLYDSATDDTFAKYYEGAVGIGAELNPYNNRYNATMEFDAVTDIVSAVGPWARYNIAMVISGKPGTTVTAYADGIYTFLKPVPGNPVPNSSQSASDICTGFNVVNVGMYNSRETSPRIGGNDEPSGYQAETVNIHSGYGTLVDGRTIPMTVAPGGTIVSAFSRPCFDTGYSESFLSAKDDFNGTTVYWIVNSGTSMSTPYVAGSIATWLQANPKLTVADIRQIISDTNREPVNDPSDPRNGLGWFDPYAGLVEAIKRSGVYMNMASHELAMRVVDRSMVIDNPLYSEIRYAVYSAYGLTVCSGTSGDSRISLDLSALPESLLIVRAIGNDGSKATMKIDNRRK